MSLIEKVSESLPESPSSLKSTLKLLFEARTESKNDFELYIPEEDSDANELIWHQLKLFDGERNKEALDSLSKLYKQLEKEKVVVSDHEQESESEDDNEFQPSEFSDSDDSQVSNDMKEGKVDFEVEAEEESETQHKSGSEESDASELDYESDSIDIMNLKYEDYFDPKEDMAQVYKKMLQSVSDEEAEDEDDDDDEGEYDDDDEEEEEKEQDANQITVKNSQKKKSNLSEESEEYYESDQESNGDEDEEMQQNDSSSTTIANVSSTFKSDVPLSTFERHQLSIADKISAFEAENMSSKPWTLSGEVTSKARPMNSLLEEVIEYDTISKPVPMITEESTETLEEMIKRRILEASWNDPQINTGTMSSTKGGAASTRDLPELSAEKNPQSLSALYETDYSRSLTEAKSVSTVAEEKKSSIDALWRSVCLALDALSHFTGAHGVQFDPQQPTSTTGVASLMMEESLPIAIAPRQRLAPEEIHSALLKPLKVTSEKSRDERHTDHLNKKRSRKRASRQAQATTALPLAHSSRHQAKKSDKHVALASLSKQKNVTILANDQKSTKTKRPRKK